MIRKIRKRDGKIADFNPVKITNAIWKAAQAVGGKDYKKSVELTDKVLERLEKELKKGEIPTVEQVQDIVEKTLIEEGHAKTAKAYILYRKQHQDIREIGGLLKDIDVVDDYLSMMDWKVQENSNMSYSLQGLNVYATENIISHYWLNKIYPPEIGEAHTNGDYHIHDLGTLGAYCVGWDLKDVLLLGFRGVSGKIESKPAKHFSTALMQIVNYLYTLQGEAAGAQALSNFDTLLAPFIRYDGLKYNDVKQEMQKFLFNMNVPTRVGFQSPFTNITLDLTVPGYMIDEPAIIGGELKDDNYSDFVDEMDMINRAFAEIMYEGDARGRPFTFPIPTYNITKDFKWDNTGLDPIWNMTAKYGIPYFSNFINSDMKPDDARSMCCRLRLDNRELRKRGGGLFGANPKTGSIGVVTINMPRIGYLAKDDDDFFERIDKLMELAKQSLIIKRELIENLTYSGLHPYSRFYLSDIKKTFGEYWKNHFSTIGLIGMNDALLNFMNK
ncbi:MAG: ribonucleoside triphosphate reductase, partial [Methanobacteriota archaeon]